jgi:hypothetical protein
MTGVGDAGHSPSRHPRSSAPQFGFTPLLVAAENAHLDVVRVLLAAGADASVRNKARTDTSPPPPCTLSLRSSGSTPLPSSNPLSLYTATLGNFTIASRPAFCPRLFLLRISCFLPASRDIPSAVLSQAGTTPSPRITLHAPETSRPCQQRVVARDGCCRECWGLTRGARCSPCSSGSRPWIWRARGLRQQKGRTRWPGWTNCAMRSRRCQPLARQPESWAGDRAGQQPPSGQLEDAGSHPSEVLLNYNETSLYGCFVIWDIPMIFFWFNIFLQPQQLTEGHIFSQVSNFFESNKGSPGSFPLQKAAQVLASHCSKCAIHGILQYSGR